MKTLRYFGLTLLLSFVSACGGGGGGGAPAPPQVPGNQAPTSSFTVTRSSGPAPLTVGLDAGASADSDGSIVRYAWTVEDTGGSSSFIGKTALYIFTQPGNFQISLTVTDDDGAIGTSSKQITIQGTTATATLTGTIQILASSSADSDVADSLTTPVSNSSFANAQAVPNPLTLGGFANQPGSGETSGNSFASGDTSDFFQIDLAGDELLVLSIADVDSADLDLWLWDENEVLVDSSLGMSDTESLIVVTPGTYFIEVNAWSGASNYILGVGQNLTTGGARSIRLSDDFVADDLIVKNRGADPESMALARVSTSSAGGPDLWRMSSPNLTFERLSRRSGRRHGLPAHGRLSAMQTRKAAVLLAAKELNTRNDIVRAEPNLIYHPSLEPNDTFYGLQWHYRNIGLPVAWDTTTGSRDVIVAVIDTGILLQHPDLAGQFVPGYDFISNSLQSNDGDGIDDNPDDPGDLAYGSASSFHGTHVGGTVAATSNNGDGVAGVAWNTALMPLRVLGIDGGTTFDIIQALRFAAGLTNNSGTVPAQRADIINMSLGGSVATQAAQDAINAVRAAGVIIIAAAGNGASSMPSYPAAYDGVVSVSATTITNTLAPYSNFGATIDVAAPGGDSSTDINGDGIGDGVISTVGEDGSTGPIQFRYSALNGTSMAAPHVAGVAALMKAVHPGLTPQEFDSVLQAGSITDDLGLPGRDNNFGHGLINAQKAVSVALSLASGTGADPGPVLGVSPGSLNFGGFDTVIEIEVRNSGTGALTVSGVSVNQPWLSVIDLNMSADGQGTYRLSVARAGLSEGTYNATVTVSSDAGAKDIPVRMQVAAVNQSADAGLHYVILFDASGNNVGDTEVVSASNGVYVYTFTNIPFGQYRIVAGTDLDDDFFLCDSGEACGTYPNLDSPEYVSVNGDLSGLDFVSGFRLNLTEFSALNSTSEEPNKTRVGKKTVAPERPPPRLQTHYE